MAVRRITPALFIRQHILGMSTRELADALGVSQSRISMYDLTGTLPARHHKKIHRLAAERKVKVKASWFQKVPWAPGVPE